MSGSSPPPLRGVVLIGLRRSGKTTVGAALARRLGRPFLDLDALCRDLSGRAPGEIIALEGEARFRELEREALSLALRQPGSVLAAGGGTPVNPGCDALLASHGTVLYLHLDPAELGRRAASDERSGERPLLAGADVVEECVILHARRDAAYRRLALAVIDAALPLEDVVERCVRALQSTAV